MVDSMGGEAYPNIAYAAFRVYPFGGGGNLAFLRSLDRYCSFGKFSLHVDSSHAEHLLRRRNPRAKLGLLHPGRIPISASLGTILFDVDDLLDDSTVIDVAEISNLPALQLLKHAKAKGKHTVTTVLETCNSRISDRLFPIRSFIQQSICFTDMFRVATIRSREYLIGVGAPPDSVRVLPIGIDSKLFFPARSERDDDRFRILFARRLESKNGVELIMNVFPKILRSVPTAELWIAGDGPLRQKVISQSAHLPVKFVGHVPYDELGDLYRKVDVYCNPAQDKFFLGNRFQEDGQYSFPLIEAQRCGLPVITTDSGANLEVLAPGNCVIPQRDPASLVDAILQVASDPQRIRLSNANAAFAALRYDAERLQRMFDRAVADLEGY